MGHVPTMITCMRVTFDWHANINVITAFALILVSVDEQIYVQHLHPPPGDVGRNRPPLGAPRAGP